LQALCSRTSWLVQSSCTELGVLTRRGGWELVCCNRTPSLAGFYVLLSPLLLLSGLVMQLHTAALRAAVAAASAASKVLDICWLCGPASAFYQPCVTSAFQVLNGSQLRGGLISCWVVRVVWCVGRSSAVDVWCHHVFSYSHVPQFDAMPWCRSGCWCAVSNGCTV